MDTTPPSRSARIIAFAAAAGALLIVFLAFRGGGPQPGPGQPAAAPAPAAPPGLASKYTECRELGVLYERMARKLGCTDEPEVTKAICEAAFTREPSCAEPMKAAVACAKNEPDTSWTCQAEPGKSDRKIGLSEGACAEQVGALTKCLQPEK